MIDTSIEASLATNGAAQADGAQPDPQETREWIESLDALAIRLQSDAVHQRVDLFVVRNRDHRLAEPKPGSCTQPHGAENGAHPHDGVYAVAFQLANLCKKPTILADYPAPAYFGSGAYGVAAAARAYFGNDPASPLYHCGRQPNAADPTCPILNLRIHAIHLNLLGLKVDTSNICLSITAQSGSGNLLGNLLCGVANGLHGGPLLVRLPGGLGPFPPGRGAAGRSVRRRARGAHDRHGRLLVAVAVDRRQGARNRLHQRLAYDALQHPRIEVG